MQGSVKVQYYTDAVQPKNMCFLDFLGEGTTTLETLEILNTKPLGKVDFCR